LEFKPEEWQKAVEFHGHACGGLMLGYYMTKLALRELGGEGRAKDEELVALAENDNCSVDALQVLSGCTAGKGNLRFLDYGKQALTLGNRKTGRAVRVSLKPGAKERMGNLREMSMEEFMNLPAEAYFQVAEVKLDLPEQARIFPSVQCSLCGESVMEPRARVKDGQIVCRACAEEYESRLFAAR